MGTVRVGGAYGNDNKIGNERDGIKMKSPGKTRAFKFQTEWYFFTIIKGKNCII